MFKSKYIISISAIIIFLISTSIIKNKTRILEKQITSLNTKTLLKKKIINEAQLEFYYLTSPSEIEKKLRLIGFDDYEPIEYSKIFFDISDFNKIQNKISKLKTINEKKAQKK